MDSRDDSYEMDIQRIMRARQVSRSEAEEFYRWAFLQWLQEVVAKGGVVVNLALDEQLQILSGQGDQLLEEIAQDPRRDELARRWAEAEAEAELKENG